MIWTGDYVKNASYCFLRTNTFNSIYQKPQLFSISNAAYLVNNYTLLSNKYNFLDFFYLI